MTVKRIALIVCFVVVLTGVTVAQDGNWNESNLFVKTLYLERVYPHQLGYMATYVGADLRLQRLFMPIEWFGVAAGRAEIVYGSERSYPYVDIYWEDGEFSHVRLHVHTSLNHISWGAIDQTEDWSDDFAVDGLELRL